MRVILSIFSVFFLSCTAAWAETSYGIFMVVKGDVKVQRSATETLNAKVSLKVLPGDTIVSGVDSRAKIVMNDRNVIFVSPQTQATIKKYEEGKNGTKNVEIELKEGKVFNNVQQKYDGDKSKYIIKTPTAVAGVRGTSFYAMFSSATQRSEVITQTGTVFFSSIGRQGTMSAPVEVSAGQGSVVAKIDAPPAAPKTVPADQMKSLENNVIGTPAPAPAGSSGDKSSGGSKDSKDSGGTGTPGPTTGDIKPPSDGFRMDDKKDTAVGGVDKIPDAAPPPPPLIPPTAPINRPPTRTPVTDAVRGKTDKSIIKIIPTPAPSPRSAN